MPRGGSRSRSRSRSRSGGFRSSRFFGRSSRSPNAPDEVVVKYPNGGLRVVGHSDYDPGVFPSELSSDSKPKGLSYKCKCWLEYTLLSRHESFDTPGFRKAVKDKCGIVVNACELKNDENRPHSRCNQRLKLAIEKTLRNGSESLESQVFRRAIKEGCGIEVNIGDTKDDVTSTGVLKIPPSKCNTWLRMAIEATLFDGSESVNSQTFRRAVKENCGIEVDVGELKNGSTSTSSVQN